MKSPNIGIRQRHRLGIYEKAINAKFSWPEKFALAKEARFDFIEVSVDESDDRLARLNWGDETIDAWRAAALRAGVDVNSMCLSANRRFPLGSKDPSVRAQGLDVIHRALRFAKRAGIRIVQLAGYDEYYSPSDAATSENFMREMAKVCALAQHYSVQIAFESMDTFYMGDLTRILNALRRLESPVLGIYPDVGNLTQFAKENFASEIELAKDKIVAFHLKDTLPDKFKKVPFGSGTVNFKEAFKAILKTGYCGPFMIEMWSENDPAQSREENLKEIADAHAFLDAKYVSAIYELG